jgi:iron complex transport system permease protein
LHKTELNCLTKTKYNFIFLAHFCACAFVFVNISLGSITIPLRKSTLVTGGQASKSSWEYIIMNYRLPKSITAVLVGMGLSISGLLMQTLFRNPLAGPYVLGLKFWCLGVAFVLLELVFATIFEHFITITLWSCFSFYHGKFNRFDSIIGVPKACDTMAILIVGLMFVFSSFTS